MVRLSSSALKPEGWVKPWQLLSGIFAEVHEKGILLGISPCFFFAECMFEGLPMSKSGGLEVESMAYKGRSSEDSKLGRALQPWIFAKEVGWV